MRCGRASDVSCTTLPYISCTPPSACVSSLSPCKLLLYPYSQKKLLPMFSALGL
ncbi:hypothetical protein FIBSPDRAFT_853145, partial [Athelia psychrophila]